VPEPTPDPTASDVSVHNPPSGTQKNSYEVASSTGSHVISSDTLVILDPGETAMLLGAVGFSKHAVVPSTPLALHVVPQSLDAFTQQVYDVYGSRDSTEPVVPTTVSPKPDPSGVSWQDPP